MGRETGLDVMGHVEVSSTLSVLALVHNLLLEIGCVGNVKPVADKIEITMLKYNVTNNNYYEHSTDICYCAK